MASHGIPQSQIHESNIYYQYRNLIKQTIPDEVEITIGEEKFYKLFGLWISSHIYKDLLTFKNGEHSVKVKIDYRAITEWNNSNFADKTGMSLASFVKQTLECDIEEEESNAEHENRPIVQMENAWISSFKLNDDMIEVGFVKNIDFADFNTEHKWTYFFTDPTTNPLAVALWENSVVIPMGFNEDEGTWTAGTYWDKIPNHRGKYFTLHSEELAQKSQNWSNNGDEAEHEGMKIMTLLYNLANDYLHDWITLDFNTYFTAIGTEALYNPKFHKTLIFEDNGKRNTDAYKTQLNEWVKHTQKLVRKLKKQIKHEPFVEMLYTNFKDDLKKVRKQIKECEDCWWGITNGDYVILSLIYFADKIAELEDEDFTKKLKRKQKQAILYQEHLSKHLHKLVKEIPEGQNRDDLENELEGFDFVFNFKFCEFEAVLYWDSIEEKLEEAYENLKGEFEFFKENDDYCCPITMEKLDLAGGYYVLGCGHRFQSDALDTWEAEHNTCPLCRCIIEKD